MRAVWWMVFAAGCSANAQAVHPSRAAPSRREPAQEARTEEEPEDGLTISGLTGSMDADAIDMALRPQLQTGFFDCFARRESAIPVLGGSARLRFHVDGGGRVLRADLIESTLGDRDTEVCVREVARRTRFQAPRGRAEATFSWGFEFDAPDDVPPPIEMSREGIAETLMMNTPSLAPCSPPAQGTRIHVTIYVQPGGTVLSAGAASEDPNADTAIACLLPVVRTWIFPDPMNSLGKTSFDWP